MTAHIEDILLWAISRKGIEYVYGAEADGKPDPRKIDCSELVQWACQQAGMRSVPDGAIWQYKWCERAHSLISVEQALKTRGALMFPYPNVHHVVFSLGDGTTMEAKGAAYGVGMFSAKGRFQRAALIPGVDYSPRKPLAPQEDDMTDAERQMLHDCHDMLTLLTKGAEDVYGILPVPVAVTEIHRAVVPPKPAA